ncbi:g7187 [Coccomyxa elongata]
MKDPHNPFPSQALDRRSAPFLPRISEVLVSVALFVALVSFCISQNSRTAVPLSAVSRGDVFSESRALRLTEQLANDFPHRQVGAKHYNDASAFLLGESQRVQELSVARDDLRVEVACEHATGATDLDFLHADFTNAYINISNVVLKIIPVDAVGDKAVLVNAHFDSTLGSPGASDCASCVGVALELARLLVSDESRKLQAPVVFLLNGGEEAFLLGAHAFREHSRFNKGLGAIINLESTGPGGPDIVFQHSGSWTMKSYARVASRPRGTVIAQDFFEAGILPADTDFRMMSAKYLGNLPGVDIAFLLDSGAYHSTCDVPERIRPGTLQAMGNNVAELIVQFGMDLSSGNDIVEEDEKLIFFDVLGLLMVTYPMRLAKILHRTPLLLALLMPLVTSALSLKQQHSIFCQYLEIVKMLTVALFSAICTVLAPVLFSLASVFCTGQPMAWVGHSAAAYALYIPMALAGAVMPYALVPDAQPRPVLLGFAVLMGTLAELLTGAGLGAGYVLAAWAMAAIIASLFLAKEGSRVWMPWLILVAAPVILLVAPPALMLSLHIVQKASTSGAPFLQYGTDATVALVLGLSFVGCTGFLGGQFAMRLQQRLWAAVMLLCLISSTFGICWTRTMKPYTVDVPKKIYMYHMHHVDGAGHVQKSTWDLAAIDSAPVSWALPADLASLPGEEWKKPNQLVLHPVNNYMQGISLPAPAPLASGGPLPHIDLINNVCVNTSQSGSCGAQRLHISLSFPRPGFYGALNVTGDMLAWSLTNRTWPAHGNKAERIARFTGADGSNSWSIWVVIVGGGQLQIDLVAAIIADAGSQAASMAAAFPPWTSLAVSEAYHVHWAWPSSRDLLQDTL